MNKKIAKMYNRLLPFWEYKKLRLELEQIYYPNSFYYTAYGYYCNYIRSM